MTVARVRVSRNTDVSFAVLQDNLSKIGYQLTQSSSFRVGNIVKNRAQYIVNKTQSTSNGSVRKAMRSAFWCKVALHPDEILHGPNEIMSALKRREEDKEDNDSKPSSRKTNNHLDAFLKQSVN